MLLKRCALAAAALVLFGGCSSVKKYKNDDPIDGIDSCPAVAGIIAENAKPGRSKLGQIGVAPCPMPALRADEAAKDWKAEDVFDAGQLQDDIQRTLTATKSYDNVRRGKKSDLKDAIKEAYDERDKWLLLVSLENVRITWDYKHPTWELNIVNWLFWMAPSWWVAPEDYTLAFDARVVVRNGLSGRQFKEEVIPITTTESFDEWDQGTGPIDFLLGWLIPFNNENNWRKVATKLLPEARQNLTTQVASFLDQKLREQKGESGSQDVVTLSLAVGISQYKDTQTFAALDFAAQDASAMRVALLKLAGAQSGHVRTLADVDATLDGFKTQLKDHFSRATDKDNVIIYFSGYGTRTANGAPELLFHDAGPGSGRITLEELVKLLDGVKGKKLILLDASFDGGNRSVAGGAAAPGRDDLAAIQRPGLTVMLAASHGEPALSPAFSKGGLFTYHVIRALGGKADTNNDGEVSWSEFINYVRTKVRADAGQEGSIQTPTAQGSGIAFTLSGNK